MVVVAKESNTWYFDIDVATIWHLEDVGLPYIDL